MALREFETEFEAMHLHCWEGGKGFPIIMMHGSGAGASIMGNFKRVIEPLTSKYRILAADLVGFGQSGRKTAEPFFDIEMWLRQGEKMIELIGGGPVGIIGHSLSGALALKIAARNPNVSGVMTTGTMGAAFQVKEGTSGWTYPETREQLEKLAAGMVFDKTQADKSEVEYRAGILYAPGYRDYFKSMFSLSRQAYIDATALSSAELQKITCPVMLVHGENDASFTPEQATLPLAKGLPNADALILKKCAHGVALDRPAEFLAAVDLLFGKQS